MVCNQATIAFDLVHVLDHLLPHHRAGKLNVRAAFGPQHGIWGFQQDNMIEWEGYEDPRTGLRFFSLYGTHREPTDEMLAGIERMVVDVPDIGTRYYTFIWTTALVMKACERNGIPVTILDRPNPIDGVHVQGTMLDPEYASFVGLYPIPMRHGMTLGELAQLFKARYFPKLELDVVRLEGWQRAMRFRHTGLPWAMPSPNMPTPETALVYPGQCLIEGTQMSEGRGTTRPFEIFGAPYIEAWRYAEALNQLDLPGVAFRPTVFQPTFQKHADETCQGATMHVTDENVFDPCLATYGILRETVALYGEEFKWLDPPYEYEDKLLPIDILAGNSWLREASHERMPLAQVQERMLEERLQFEIERKSYLIY